MLFQEKIAIVDTNWGKIMSKYNTIVEKLIKQVQARHDIIAACVYGSQIQNIATESSDLDVLLITGNGNSYRGCSIIDGVEVEYFIKSFITIMNEIETNHKRNNPFYTSLFRNCEVLMDQNEIVLYLQNMQQMTENQPLILPKKQDTSTICYYQSKWEEDPFFEHNYYVLLECIRQYYHQKKGYSQIPFKNVLDLYQNQQMAEYYCVNLPDSAFKNFFLECTNENSSKEEKKRYLEQMLTLINYTKLNESSSQPNYFHTERILNYIITFVNGYKKLIRNKEKYGSILYPYHNLLEQISLLNQKCIDYHQASILSFTEYEQLLANPNHMGSYLSELCDWFSIQPSQYEILDFTKKHRN